MKLPSHEKVIVPREKIVDYLLSFVQIMLPPAKAEEMYHPDPFGRTGTDFVKVE